MGEWQIKTVEEIAAPEKSALATGPFGSAIGTKTFRDHGIPVIRGGNLSTSIGIRLIDNGLVYVDEELANRFKRSIARCGDLVFTCWGTTNQVGLIDDRAKFDQYVVSNKQMKLTPNNAKTLPLFLYYFFSSPEGQRQIANQTIGSSVPGFNLTGLKSIILPVPTISEQLEIINILGALDDKIDLNHRMNETLEAMAQAIFKDWFIDFGPVRAKAEGCPPYLAPDIWALFPDALDDNDKPMGWKEKRIDDILELAYGKALKSNDRLDGSFPVYGSGGITGYHALALVEGPSIIVGRKGTVGSLYWEDGPFFPIDTVFYVKPKVPLTFCFYLLQTLGLDEMNTDAAVPGLNRNNVYRLPVSWSQESVREAFDGIAKLLRQKMRKNTEESQTLSQLRDLLLPKLMSGEICLRDAEKIIEKIA